MGRCGQPGGRLKGRIALKGCKLFLTLLDPIPAYRLCASIPKLIPLGHVLYWLSPNPSTNSTLYFESPRQSGEGWSDESDVYLKQGARGTEPSQTENASLYDVDGFTFCQQVQMARKHAQWHSGEISKSRYRWADLVSFAYLLWTY
jgi:hypothetical protein